MDKFGCWQPYTLTSTAAIAGETHDYAKPIKNLYLSNIYTYVEKDLSDFSSILSTVH